ncbi:hypothetical protein FKP32DRAFT_1412135 [Trametes sanguinea]|nr:hypothetical protein FKP32DRAFT_1412135 [Trametes sanguinea]
MWCDDSRSVSEKLSAWRPRSNDIHHDKVRSLNASSLPGTHCLVLQSAMTAPPPPGHKFASCEALGFISGSALDSNDFGMFSADSSYRSISRTTVVGSHRHRIVSTVTIRTCNPDVTASPLHIQTTSDILGLRWVGDQSQSVPSITFLAMQSRAPNLTPHGSHVGVCWRVLTSALSVSYGVVSTGLRATRVPIGQTCNAIISQRGECRVS